mgnify:FL=1
MKSFTPDIATGMLQYENKYPIYMAKSIVSAKSIISASAKSINSGVNDI